MKLYIPGSHKFSRYYCVAATAATASSRSGGVSRSISALAFAPSSSTSMTSKAATTAAALPRMQQQAQRSSSSMLGKLLGQQQQRRVKARSGSTSGSSTCSFSTSSSSSENTSTASSRISSIRGRGAVSLLPTYLADARMVEKYCPVNAPNGALQLGIAESQMLEDWLVPAISLSSPEDTSGGVHTLPADCIYYQPTHGRESFRKVIAQYLQRILNLNTEEKKNTKLDIDGIVVGAGCNAVLENLCFCLADINDAVLIPTPYYAAFEFDLVARAGLSIVPVTTFDYYNDGQGIVEDSTTIPVEAYYPTRASLDAAYKRSLDDHNAQPKVLLLSHPQNPLGICYPPHVIQECIDWCRENQVHLVSDEIYAGSVYNPQQANFKSVLEVAAANGGDSNNNDDGLGLGPYIHFVYALSKDFALSGLRVGVCYSENPEIRVPMQKLNDLCQISSQTQHLVEHMLSNKHIYHPDYEQQEAEYDDAEFWEEPAEELRDEYWTDAFRKVNHERLQSRCERLQQVLDDGNIPYLPGTSGLFLWMDLSEFLIPINDDNDSSFEDDGNRERELYLQLINDYGLLFTPGLSMKTERPGFFRCVFTACKDDEFELALQRIQKFVTTAKRSNT